MKTPEKDKRLRNELWYLSFPGKKRFCNYPYMVTDTKKRFLIGAAILAVTYAVGIAGHAIVGGHRSTFFDAVYRTTIIISTADAPVSHTRAEKTLTMFLLIGGVGTLLYMLTTATAFIVEGELAQLMGRRRMDKRIGKMRDHYIVCGGGETARNILAELEITGREAVFIESDPERIEKLSETLDVAYVQGDATTEDALEKAGIKNAAGVIYALPEDRDNIMGVLTARGMNPETRIVTKGVDARVGDKMIKAGANATVSPAFIGALRLVSEMIRPQAVAFMDDMLRLKKEIIRVEEVILGEDTNLVGKTIATSNIQQETGFLIVAIREAGVAQFTPSPPPTRSFKAGDILIVMGDPTRLEELRTFVGGVSSRQVTRTTVEKISDAEKQEARNDGN